jgi:hypothetical protein
MASLSPTAPPPLLVHQRCLNHPAREAVARCPECARFFCRECVVEHEDRILCAACLAQTVRGTETKRRSFANLWRVGFAALGIATAWLFFNLLGHMLLRIPASFHEGTVWQQSAESEP